MMEINNVNKRIFYAMYGEFDNLDSPISLKSCSSITDEDAIEVAKVYKKSIKGSEFPKWFTGKDYANCGRAFCCRTELTPSAWDYLRSKGYALGWLSYTVEDLITAGWIKLTNNGSI